MTVVDTMMMSSGVLTTTLDNDNSSFVAFSLSERRVGL